MTQDISNDDRERIIDALYAGRKIEAIKIYRQATDTGLAPAKEFIEQLGSRLREETPEKFTSPSRKGCGTSVLIVIVAALLGGGFATFTSLGKRQQPAPPAPAAADVIEGDQAAQFGHGE